MSKGKVYKSGRVIWAEVPDRGGNINQGSPLARH